MEDQGPDFTRAVDVRAFLGDELHMCGCHDLEEIVPYLRDVLRWHETDASEREPYGSSPLFHGSHAIFYIISGALDAAGLTEHGVSARCAFLTNMGRALLLGLETMDPGEIDCASGGAYNDCTYE
jgi:hypothetical protein